MRTIFKSIPIFTFLALSLLIASPSFAQKKTSKAKPTGSPVKFSAKDVWTDEIHKRADHKILVIQNRKYTKKGKFELGIDFNTTLASAFHNTFGAGLSATYYFNEYWGLNLAGNVYTSFFSGDGKQLDDFFKSTSFPAGKEYLEPQRLLSAGLIWSPIYGKFAFFRKNIIHFDIFGTLGASQVTTISDFFTSTGSLTGDEHEKSYIGSMAGLGTKVYLSKYWTWTTQLKHYAFKADYQAGAAGANPVPAESVWTHYWQLTTGISVMLGGN